MGHWFDSLTKQAAARGLSRREAFAMGLGGAAGAIAPRAVLAQPMGGGARRTVNGLPALESTASFEDLTYRRTASYNRISKISTLSLIISRGSTPILDLEATTQADGESTGSAVYGQGVGGIRSVTMTLHRGGAIDGAIDGRAFTAQQPRSIEALRFADGGAPPRVILDPILARQLDGLSQQLRATVGQRSGGPGSIPGPDRRGAYQGRPEDRSSARGPDQRLVDQRLTQQDGDQRNPYQRGQEGASATGSYRGAPSSRPPQYGNPPPRGADPQTPNEPGSGANWYPAGEVKSDQGGACSDCERTCEETGESCWGQVFITALFVCAPCAIGDGAACNVSWVICREGCYAPGSGCCPVGCGATLQNREGIPVVTNCCDFKETCISQSDGGLCCPAQYLACGNQCCDADIVTCAPGGGCGCRYGLTACGDQCCGTGQVCCGGQCCSPGQCQNGLCCAAFCGDQCCPPFNTCCNGVCCPANAMCIDGRCCPQIQVCGSTCCANGMECLDPRAGRCGAPLECRSDLRACRSQVNGAWTTLCCRPQEIRRGSGYSGVTCCNGQCCGGTQMCCYNKFAGSTGCWDISQCDRPN